MIRLGSITPNDCLICPVTFVIALLAIAATSMWNLSVPMDWAFLNANLMDGEVWRVLSSAFPHVSILHLAFNLYWLWVFGTVVERNWGSPKAAYLYTYLHTGAALAQYAFDEGGVGLSGLGYGLWSFLWVVGRRTPAFRGVVTREVTILFAVWFVVCVLLTRMDVMRVGNVAHLSGAILGGVVGLAVTHQGTKRLQFLALATVLVALSVFSATILRPFINANAAEDLAFLAHKASEAGDQDRAIDLYCRALTFGSRAHWWFNLGCSYYRNGDHQKAEAAMEEAFRVDRSFTPPAEYLSSLRAVAAYAADQGGDLEEAERLYREALHYTPRAAALWYNVGGIMQRTGRMDEALSACAKACELEAKNETYRQGLEAMQKENASRTRVLSPESPPVPVLRTDVPTVEGVPDLRPAPPSDSK